MKKELIDQSAHFAVAFALLGLITWAPSLLTFMLAGLGMGVIREVTEEGTPVTLEKLIKGTIGSWHDLVAWTVGGAAAWFVFG